MSKREQIWRFSNPHRFAYTIFHFAFFRYGLITRCYLRLFIRSFLRFVNNFLLIHRDQSNQLKSRQPVLTHYTTSFVISKSSFISSTSPRNKHLFFISFVIPWFFFYDSFIIFFILDHCFTHLFNPFSITDHIGSFFLYFVFFSIISQLSRNN